MKPRPLLRIFSVYILVCVSYAVNPACECVTYQSYGRSQGTFTSPNFPLVYPPNINCILYTFIGDLEEIVELTFLEFDLKVPVTNKCTDFLRFFLDIQRPEVNEATIWQYELCGNISMIQKKHYSSGRSMILEFHTDSFQGNHTGYRGIFRFLDKAQFQITGGNRRWGTQCTYDFYSNKTPKRGQFFSPRFPQNYPPNANCQYVFYGMEGERVKIVFKNLQLENIDGSCSSSPDTIVVRDGVDATAPVIAQYCNTRNGELIISSGENMYIEFLVDSRKQRQGFAASFQFIKDEQPAPQSTRRPPGGSRNQKNGPNTHSPGDSPRRIGPTVPTTKMIIPKLNKCRALLAKRKQKLDKEKEEPATECVTEFSSSTAKNGTFQSTNFPESYPSNTICRYVFQGKGLERVQIIFTELDMHYPSGDPKAPYDCEDVDSVTVGVFIDGQPRNLGVYCGNKRPPMLMSNDNRLEVEFHSVGPGNGAKGFKANYKFVTDFGIKNGEQSAENMVCSFIFRSEKISNGTFTSPNFPGLYPRNTECHYLFYGSTSERIHITFPYFDVEGIPPACTEDTQSDFVEFSNFNIKLKDRKMHRFCGTREDDQKKEEKSDGNFFRVTFKSNDVYDATGFEAFYQFRKYEGGVRAVPTRKPPRKTTDNDPYIPPNKRVEASSGANHVIPASLPVMLLVLLLSS